MATPGEHAVTHLVGSRPAAFEGGLREIAAGTYAWLQPSGDWGESNAGLICGNARAALVDTAWDARLARRIVARATEAADRAPDVLLLTHGDGDHVFGMPALSESVEIVASTATADQMAHEDPAALARSARGAALLARIGLGPARTFGRYLDRMLGPYDFADAGVRAPGTTFDGQLTVDVGGRQARLVELGPAHSPGDTAIWLDDVRVLFAGDLVFSGITPNSWTGDVDGWRRALERLAALGAEIVVPGHGPVGDASSIAQLDAYFAWLQRRVHEELAAGRTVDDAAFRIVTGDDLPAAPWGGWRSPERTVLTVLSLQRQRRGASPAIEHGERPRALWKVAQLAARLARHGRAG